MEEPHSAGILPWHTQPQFILHHEAVLYQRERQGLRSRRKNMRKVVACETLSPAQVPMALRGQEGTLSGGATAARRERHAEVVVP